MLFALAMLVAHRVFRRFGARVLFAIVAGAWLLGMTRFLGAKAHATVTLPRQAASPLMLHDLASWQYGPTVRASSYYGDPLSQHHPLFLVDGRAEPTTLEKWASSLDDRHPWVEITWREPRELERIVLRHAGAYEEKAYTMDRYTLTCVRDDGVGPSIVVVDNHADVATHDLACSRARGVRLDVPLVDGEIARLFELEAWGR